MFIAQKRDNVMKLNKRTTTQCPQSPVR